MSLQIIRKGDSLPFDFDRGDEDIDGWICTIQVKRYPTDDPLIERVITPTDGVWSGILSSTDTAILEYGHHFLIGKLEKAETNQAQEIPIRFHVGREWHS